jgi:hypothetical protein
VQPVDDVEPRIGYEGDQILDILAAYPRWRIVQTFEVAETPGAHDRAALVVKGSRTGPRRAD